MSKPVDSNKLWYRCMDGGKIVHVDPRCYYESGHVRYYVTETEEENMKGPDPWEISQWKSWLNEDQKFGHFPISVHITSKILSKVNDFCVERFEIYYKHRFDDDRRQLIHARDAFDYKFLENNSSLALLVQLMDAAAELKIKSLLDMTRNAIVDKLDGKSADEILKIFDMPDFADHLS